MEQEHPQRAMLGKSTLMMTSGGMVEHAQRRIEAYCKEAGAEIEVIRIGRGDSLKSERRGERAASQEET